MQRTGDFSGFTNKHLRKRRKLEVKENLRFEDYHKVIEEDVRSKEKVNPPRKNKQDIADYQTFAAIDPKKVQLKLFDHLDLQEELEEEFCINIYDPDHPHDRNPEKRGLEDFVSFVFDEAALDLLIEYNLQQRPGMFPRDLDSNNPGNYFDLFHFSWLFRHSKRIRIAIFCG